MSGPPPDAAEWRRLWRHLRAPAMALLALLLLLGVNVLLGAGAPTPAAPYVESCVVLGMVLTVLLVSMEILREPPIIRLFSALGFFWLLVMFGMTLVDYLSR